MHYLMLATLFDHALPVFPLPKYFTFTGMIHMLCKFASHEKKKVAKFVHFFATATYECLIF